MRRVCEEAVVRMLRLAGDEVVSRNDNGSGETERVWLRRGSLRKKAKKAAEMVD